MRRGEKSELRVYRPAPTSELVDLKMIRKENIQGKVRRSEEETFPSSSVRNILDSIAALGPSDVMRTVD